MVNNDIIETVLIGTGGGYGESIVIHLGNNDWIVIDSCVNPKTMTPLPLDYLKEKGVDFRSDVKLIICTHWHDDHILGLSTLLKECENAIFSFAHATDRVKFLKLVKLDFNKIKDEATISSTIEISNCLEIVSKRDQIVKRASEDRILLKKEIKGLSYEVISLSPSDFVLQQFDEEISTLITEYGDTNKKIINNRPNDKSVAILVKINDHRILLGSDLEVAEDRRKGWHCIVDKSQAIDSKSMIFKIPHHGSATGYNKDVWNRLVDDNAIAKLSSWNRGAKLPNLEMLETFLDHTESLFITSLPISNSKPKKRDKDLSKTINKFNSSLREVKYVKGIVRCYCGIEEKDWKIETYDSARKFTLKDLINHKKV